MHDYEIVKYKHEGIELDIRVSLSQKTAWLSLKDLSYLFARDKSVISRHIRKIFEENKLKKSRVVAENATTGVDGKTYNITFYNLDVVMFLARKIKPNRVQLLKDFIDDYFENNNNQNSSIIIYNNGSLEIPLEIVPKEETIWATSKAMADIFDTTERNINTHIHNIYNDEEIEISVGKKSFLTHQITKRSLYFGRLCLLSFWRVA